MKRLLSSFASDIAEMNSNELKKAIITSEGRTIMAESIVTAAPVIDGISNAEIVSAFSSDLILLNEFDFKEKSIPNVGSGNNVIKKLKKLTGRIVGVNLEPVSSEKNTDYERVNISSGRVASESNFKLAKELSADFILLTGNPGTGVTKQSILKTVRSAKKNYDGLVFAGKMHSSGINESYIDAEYITNLANMGVDGILFPCAGTVPGISKESLSKLVKFAKSKGLLTIGAIGTSQEGARKEDISNLALRNKEVGFDIYHIGDGGFGRIAPPENIMALSLAIRGLRHTYFKMSESVIR